MFDKKIDVNAPIHELISARWSGRAYDSDKMLSRSEIISLLEAARWAPSCSGIQPWRFIVCDKSSNENSWRKALECLSPGNHDWAKNAPLLLLSCADTMGQNNNINRWGEHDTGAAYQLAEDKIPENMREREYSDRTRNSLDINFFEGTWNEPVHLSN